MALIPTITVDQLPGTALLLDVREPAEWAAGHIDGALHVPMNELPGHLAGRPDALSTQTPIVVVCKVGGRSAHVTAWLNQQGFDAMNLDGGMLAWAASRKPMVSETGAPAEVI